jgi:hypothetical protein
MADFEALLEGLEAKVKESVVERTREATEQLLADSRVVVPYQEGDLSRAGDAKTRATADGAEGKVLYDIVYARKHELDESLRHQDQGQAHYLGGTARANAQKYIGHIAKAVTEDLG